MQVRYLPSQVDATASTAALPYTASPFALLWDDSLLFLRHILRVPGIIWPLHPWGSGALDELYPSWQNLVEITLHTVLIILQLLFLVSLPLCLFYPLFAVAAYVGTFLLLNRLICLALNGRQKFLTSNVNLDHLPKHAEERWIFVNGVAVGRHWLQNNVNRLAKTFGREVVGVHNPTTGIIFDAIQCIIERCFCYATADVRNGYILVRRTLKDSKYKKIVLVLHSQGGIEGGLMLDWLLADLPEVCFQKLEVYTFASAANHFNNPICSYPIEGDRTDSTRPERNRNPTQRVIRHVEHYANSGDIISMWGVLHFTRSAEHRRNRFIGQLFERRANCGHQLNQHYLDNMFAIDPVTDRVKDSNEFMDTLVDVDDEEVLEREPRARSASPMAIEQLHLEDADSVRSAVEINARQTRRMPVKELSRLWKYRNGGSP